MPNIESVKRDIQALGKSGQEAIFKYLANYMYLWTLDLEKQFIYSYVKYLNVCGYIVYN